MPAHKQQHFVPRCYLKPFTLDEAGTAINLYNISRSKAVRNAPAKGQCARNYLYGVDLDLERTFQKIEGGYATALRILQDGPVISVDQDISFLLAFALVQYSRTHMAAQRNRMIYEGIHDSLYEGRSTARPDIDVSDRRMIRESMRICAEGISIVEDLKTCIVKNQTEIDFVTSDDPSVLTNRLCFRRLLQPSFGLASSGILFFLPLTPRLLLICYDGGVYTIPGKKGHFVSATREADIFALNELQYLKAAENIYLADWRDRARVEREFGETRLRRPQSWCQISAFVSDRDTERGEFYRPATDEERTTESHLLFSLITLYPNPSRWFSMLKYRKPMQTYSDGSTVGHVRKAEWLTDEGLDNDLLGSLL